MDFSTGTLVGQIIGLLLLATILYLIALVPISLKKIAAELAAIKEELRKQNPQKSDYKES